MTTKAQILEQIRALFPDMADHLTAEKANKATIEAALADLQEAETGNTDEMERKVMGALREARKGYVSLERTDGGKSMGCGDEIQQVLLVFGPANLKDLASMADVLLGLCPANKVNPEQGHWDRYAHLNNGQIRMNIGNRLRGGLKRGTLVMDGDVLKRA